MGSIDVDPASNDMAQEWVQAGIHHSIDDDGLEHEWRGNVWLNPPYKPAQLEPFAKKLLSEIQHARVVQACWLSPPNNLGNAAMQELMVEASAICHHSGRVGFINSKGMAKTSAQDSAILYFGHKVGSFISVFSQFGTVFTKGD